MATCATCERYLTPTSLQDGCRCPFCGGAVDTASDVAHQRPEGGSGTLSDRAEDLEPIPWHLKAFLGAAAIYLGFRAWQLVEMLWK